MNEKIIETKTCRLCSAKFDITDKDLEFYEKVSPVFDGKKYSIPTPTLCPDCRQQRRLCFRNERTFYTRKCDLCNKSIVSMYSPDKPDKVYCAECWWSDKWDPMNYGLDVEYNRSFFEQIGELNVPKLYLNNSNSENSIYTNYVYGIKNCYLSSICYLGCEDVYYSYYVLDSKNLFDCYISFNSQVCYESVNLTNCFYCFYSQNLSNCKNCYFSINLENCSNCIYCNNLLNKEYHIYNNKVSVEEFNEFIKKEHIGSYRIIKNSKEKLNNIKNRLIVKNLNNKDCEGCLGDYLQECKNVKNSFSCKDDIDSKYIYGCSGGMKDSYDITGGGTLDIGYESVNAGPQSTRLIYCYVTSEGHNLIACSSCYNGTNNCFGCTGLRNKSYCILNKQYTKEEYEKLVPKIIEHMQKTGEWGEFFPSSISPFGYNETVANEYYPLSKEETIKKGFKWSDYEPPFPKVNKVIPASKLPDNISDIPDDILNWAIKCEVTSKPFRIIKQELDFYRKHNLPIPRRHPDQRHLDRMKLRNPRKLFMRICDCPDCEENNKIKGIIFDDTNSAINPKTGKKGLIMQTTYAPDRLEIVYCENCYEKEVY